LATQDPSEQLNVTAKLAAQMERMAAAAERLESSYDSQIAAVQQLAAAFSSINAQGAVQGIEVLNRTLKETANQMQETGRISESTFRSLNKKLEESGKSFASRFPKSVAVATAAMTGLRQGVSNVIALGKGFAGFAGGVVDGLANITASIIAIPLKIFQGLVDMAARAGHGSTELAQALEDLRKQFGAFYAPTNKAIIGTSKSLKGFEATGLSAFRVFGNMAMRLNYMREMATEMGASFNLLRKEFEDNGGAVLAYRKGLGLTAEQMKAVSQRSDMMGTKSSKTLKDMTKYSYELADAFGLDAKVISREVGEAMKDVGRFGTTTVKSLSESVTFAHRFGLELKDISGVLDKYLSFDDAAEGAANLSQAFGANIDSFALMKASAEGDVGKSVEILRRSFRDAGVDATKFTAVERKLIAQNTGLSDSAIQAAFSLKKQSTNLDQVQKVGDKAAKKTMTQEEAMAKLADAIERIVMSGMGMKGGFWDQWFAGIQAGIQSSGEFLGLMRNIQQALHRTYMIGMKLGRDLVKIVPGFAELLGGLRDFFNPNSFGKMFQNISDAIRRYFDPKSEDKGSIPKLFAGLKKSVTDMFTSEGTAGKKILEGFKTFFGMMLKTVAETIKWMSDRLAEGLTFMVDLLTGKKRLDLSGAASSGQGSLGFLLKVIQPLGEALKHAWIVLKDPLKQLVSTLFDKLVELLKSDAVMSRLKPALGGLAVILFGPAFTQAIVAALTTSIAKGAIAALSGGTGKKAYGDLVGKAADAADAARKVPTSGAADLNKVGEVNKAASNAVDKGKGWGVKDAVALGLKLVAIATALAVGGVEMALAFVAMKKILDAGGVKEAKDIIPSMAVLGAMVVAAVPLAFSLRLASKIGSMKDVLVGGLIVTAAVAIVGAVGAGISYLLTKVGSPAELNTVGTLMLKMSGVFLAMIPLIAASIAIGALASGPQAAVLAMAAVGIGIIGIAVGEMAGIAMGIVKVLATLKIDASFQHKIDAFLNIMKAIQSFTDALVKVIHLMQPSFTDLLAGTKEKFSEKINAARDLIAEMVGAKGGGKGIIGLVETVMDSLKQLSIGSGLAEKASVFSNVLQAIAAVMQAMTPPPSFFEAGSSFLVQLGGPKPFADLATDVAYYMSLLRDSMLTMILGDKQGKGGIIDIITKLGAIKLPDTKAAETVASLLSAISGVMKAITPSGDTLKAFSTTAEAALIAVGPLKLGARTVTQIDADQLSKSFQVMGEQLGKLLPALTTGVLSDVLSKTKDVSPEQMDRLKVAAEILKTSVEAGRLITESFSTGSTQAATVNSSAVNRLTEILPAAFTAVGNLQKQIGEGISTSSLKGFSRNMSELSTVIRGDEQGKSGIVGALQAVSDMVKQANDLDKALADGNLNKIDIKARLERVAKSVGLGGKASYTVDTGKNVVITVNMQVVMSAGEVEKAIIFNKSSIIADRLNFATQRTNPPGSDTISRDVEPQFPLMERGK